jgi:hypothetical protein
MNTSPSGSCGCGSSLPTQLPSLGTSMSTSVSPGTSVITPSSTTSSDSATTDYLHPFPFSNSESSRLCLESALAIADAFDALPFPVGGKEGGGVGTMRTMPSFACCAMQSAYTLLMVYHRTWVLQQQQQQREDSSQIHRQLSSESSSQPSPQQAEQQIQQQRTHHPQTQALLTPKHQAQTLFPGQAQERASPQDQTSPQTKTSAQQKAQETAAEEYMQQQQTTTTQLLEKCEDGLKRILEALDNYSIAFEALRGMKDQVQVAIDCLSLV